MYPAYTTDELVNRLETKGLDGATRKEMEEEVEARRSGASKQYVVPQIEGGKPVNKIGRM